MKRLPDEFYIGLAMTVATLIVIVGVLYLSNSNFLQKGLTINVVVADAGNLTTGDDVYLLGVKIGSVKAIHIQRDNVVVQLKIEEHKSIPEDSRFVIRQKNLLGEKMVTIIQGKSARFLPNNARVPGEVDLGMSELSSKAKELSDRMISLLEQASAVIGGEDSGGGLYAAVNRLNGSLEAIDAVLNQNRSRVSRILQNVEAGSRQFQALGDTSSVSLARLLRGLEENNARLAVLLKESSAAATSLDTILNRLQAGKGSLGKLATDDSLYVHMTRTFRNLDSLLTQMKKNPDKYLNVKVKLF